MNATASFFDPEWAAQVAEFCAKAYAEYASSPRATIGQAAYAMAADVALDCGLVTYALGADPADVRIWIARAAHALGEVFRLRGSEAAVPSLVVTEHGVDQATRADTDLSLTNLRRGLLAMYVALVAGDRRLAERIADQLGDASDARSPAEASANEEQQLASALRALLLGQDAVAFFHARGLADGPPSVAAHAAALNALIAGDQRAFLDALRRLLEAHTDDANDERNAREPRLLMSLPGLGLSALAVTSGLLELHELPADEIYLPLMVIRPISREEGAL
jgi:Immunity protein 49